MIVVKEDLTDSNMVEKFNKCKHGMVEISVEDEGIGIKKEDQAKLFKLFGFLDRTQELNPRGIGLGLYIAKQLCEQF